MKKIYLVSLVVFTFIIATINCKKKNEDPCAGVTITVAASKQDASAGQNNGSITITSPTGLGFTYSLNGAAATSSASFSNLAAGSYTITAKNANGCSGSTSVTIAASDPCAGKTITVTTPTINGQTPCEASPDGSVTVSATGSTGFQYKLGTGSYQAGTSFTGLTAGSYTVFAKDVDGCEKTTTVTVPTKAAGTLFTAVKAIVQSSCVSCHGSSGPQGGVSLSTDCQIVNAWSRIKARAVDANPSAMPPIGNPQLSAAQKTSITNWVNAGHKFSD